MDNLSKFLYSSDMPEIAFCFNFLLLNLQLLWCSVFLSGSLHLKFHFLTCRRARIVNQQKSECTYDNVCSLEISLALAKKRQQKLFKFWFLKCIFFSFNENAEKLSVSCVLCYFRLLFCCAWRLKLQKIHCPLLAPTGAKLKTSKAVLVGGLDKS